MKDAKEMFEIANQHRLRRRMDESNKKLEEIMKEIEYSSLQGVMSTYVEKGPFDVDSIIVPPLVALGYKVEPYKSFVGKDYYCVSWDIESINPEEKFKDVISTFANRTY